MSSTTKQPIVAPIYAAALTCLLYALLFPLYRPAHFICAAVATAVVFFLSWFICRSGAKKAEANAAKVQAAQQPQEAKQNSTGNPELDKMIKDGALAIEEMRRLDRNIEDEKISADIVHLQQTSEKIFNYVKTHPNKLGDIRKFMNYYLPTTLKILNSYDRMSAQGVSGENIDTTMERIQNMMDTIVAAFDKQLDSLFGDEALDISTDITVLENMMAREGLTEQQMKAESTAEPEETRGIKLEL